MSSTMINAFVFKQQNDNLLALSDAIQDVGWRVAMITKGLPGSCKQQVDELLDREMTAIASTCHCLGEVALAASNEAETWEMWAEETGANIDCSPLRPFAVQAPVAGGLAEDPHLQDILERIRSAWKVPNHEERQALCADLREVLTGFTAGKPPVVLQETATEPVAAEPGKAAQLSSGALLAGTKQLPPLITDLGQGTELLTEKHILKLAAAEDLLDMNLKLRKLGEPRELSEGALISLVTSISDARYLLNVGLFGTRKEHYL